MLRTKLIVGFLGVTFPLLILFLYNNLFAMGTVRTQVAQSNKNLVAMYMNQFDLTLTAVDHYLLNLASQDQDLTGFFTADPASADHYFYSIRLVNRISKDITYQTGANMLFAYSSQNKEFITSAVSKAPNKTRDQIIEGIETQVEQFAADQIAISPWMVLHVKGDPVLLRLARSDFGVVGAYVEINQLILPIRPLDIGKESDHGLSQGLAVFVTDQGKPLTSAPDAMVDWMAAIGDNQAYQMVGEEEKYLLVNESSHVSPIKLAVLIPDQSLLYHLKSLQHFLYWVPVAVLVLLVLYLIYLRSVFLVPINRITRAMRRLQSGDLDTRLSGGTSKEFTTMNETFNGMASEINSLKINVYEEQIRVQQAELKQLQAQIQPHFFLNCLNIVYTLAEMKQLDLVQKMVMYLVSYLRYMTKVSRTFVTLGEELAHTKTYLNIQELRFRRKFSCEIVHEEALSMCQIPPLLIQSFVENCMKHGMHPDLPVFHIRISVTSWQQPDGSGRIGILIEDNGKGFPEPFLKRWQNGEFSLDEQVNHIGIWNIERRLRLQYGDDAQMTISNREEGGAAVEIMLPRQYVSE